jgi:hypothetical protein
VHSDLRLRQYDILTVQGDYKTLVKDFDAATAEFEKALTTLREYQKSKPV